MNKYALHVAGGALLATTALASGTMAATIRYGTTTAGTTASAAGPVADGSTLISTATPFGIANNLVGGATGSAVSIGPLTIVLDTAQFTNTQLTVQVNVTGSEIETNVGSVAASLADNEGTASLSLTNSKSTGGVVPLLASDRITLLNISAVTWGALVLSGIKFRNAQALATVGANIQMNANVSGGGLTTIDSAPATTVLTSKLGSAVEVSAGASINASNTSSPQFATVTQTNSGGTSAILSVIRFTDSSGLARDLTTTASSSLLVSTYEVRLTHGVLTDTASVSTSLGVQLQSNAGVGTVTRTAAQFASNVATFTVTNVQVGAPATATIFINFNGTTSIAGQSAGSTTVTPTGFSTANTANLGGTAAVTGTATAIGRAGMNSNVNFVQPSVNAFASFIRVTNTGATAGSVTMTVRNSSSGAVLGTYTSASIASGGTIQVSTSTIETQAVPAITPTAGVPYDITVSGSITGYTQHIGFNGANGALSDLSGFRVGGSGAVP